MFGAFLASRRLCGLIDSKPMTLPQQPLFSMRTMSSRSRVTSRLAWLIQLTFSGTSAWHSSFSAARWVAMLSSTKNRKRRCWFSISATTSSMRRR